MQSIFDIALMILGVARFIVFVHLILSWLISFQVINLQNQFVAQVWYGLNRLLEPVYGPIRRMLPNMGGIDLTPLVAILGIEIVRIVLINNYPF